MVGTLIVMGLMVRRATSFVWVFQRAMFSYTPLCLDRLQAAEYQSRNLDLPRLTHKRTG